MKHDDFKCINSNINKVLKRMSETKDRNEIEKLEGVHEYFLTLLCMYQAIKNLKHLGVTFDINIDSHVEW